MAREKRKSIHYVKNAEFSQAVVDYVKIINEAKDKGEPLPIVTDYIADCFMRICEGLSHKSNFIRYTFREELVMDGVENCLKAIQNYNINAPTRTGKPNAFAYFTQITWFAFLRRIAKEKKQQEIKMKYISQAGIDTDSMVHYDRETTPLERAATSNFINTLKSRIDSQKSPENELDDKDLRK